MTGVKLAVIGGSGIYDIEGLEGASWQTVETPWGAPSDAILTGRLAGLDVCFLPRHGRGHPLPPTEVPYRANIAALKQLGVTHVLSVSAVGSFREEMAPGDFVVVDQFIDRTVNRAKTFFEAGLVAHVSVAHPVCADLAARAGAAARSAGVTVHDGGTYLAMEGPQFSTLAESRMYRESWGADVIGMTNMPEAKLAREAELHYASVAMVTDYDSWHPDHGEVDVNDIRRVLAANGAHARATVAALAADLAGAAPGACATGCATALDHALLTRPEARDPALVAKLSGIAGRVLGNG
ncbi:S-methyl-5'-thioadenosine phosphorylase [Pseudooceanicola marinus]|uniref:S-methyl-5'-thioadenosine phosphorylase n=1 Tax=Pseudooceanicola marinus TaxID=396013 RepID=A0A1X6Z2B0_9RHOB|nr:S-methyl-5'-thioadenosine phosphorylase [Pseudooceanicola marinus]PJE32518.1 S-methyl-5'-thioadenosine phosphorylase [Pseudooceanicola marinus]SLN36588.1 S-methyl-5'-thioadenosine phosphorylase [Pseudooceanicola marinus]